jgi:hypothetical protein
MPTRFYPKKMIAKIRKRKHLNAIHKEKLEKLIKETDNFDNYREEHRRQLTQLNATTLSLDNYHKNKKLKKGGSVPRGRKPKKVVDENKAMVLSQNKAIAHHTDELKTAINKSDKKVEAWVVGKVERASTDISDVTHYLEGQTEYAEGGKIAERYFVVETFPNGRKRKLMDYPDYDTAEVYARMKTNFRSKGNIITIENSQSEVMKEFKKGGKIGFEGLSDKVAKNYEGKSVNPEYQKEYGKTYSKEEAKEVGDKVASKVYRQQLAKMEMGGQVGDNALVLSANKMGYITEVGNGTYTLRFPEGTQSVFKASELQIMNDDEFAKGGDTSKYNYGRSWHMDKRKFNKSENYELPMNTRKKAMGGDLGKDYEEYEMVVVTSDVKGKFHNYRFLVVAKTITEAKKIATDLWNKNFSDMDEKFYQVMTDYKYRMDYGMADGGSVNNGNFEVVSVMLNVYDQQGDEQLYEYLQEDQGLDIVSQELKDYRKEQGVANEYFSENGKYYFVVFKKADLRNIIGFEKMMDEFFVPMGMRYTYSEQTKMVDGGMMADGGEVEGVDLFEDYEDQPKEVRAILAKYDMEDNDYETLQNLKSELESIGYTMDFGLDAEPYDLRKIGEKGKSEFYAKGGMMEYVGMTDGGRYNIVDEGKVVETNVSHKGVIDYANTTAFYDIMDESDMGDIHEISNFDDAVKYLGMVGVEVVSIGADGMSVPNKTQYFIENMGGLKDDIDFILEMNDVNYSAKGEDYILVTTPDKIKFIVSDIEDIDDPKAHDIVVRTINNVLHGTYVEPTKKRFTEGMSEKTAEKILKKLGVVGNAPKNETQKARSQANNGLVLFTPEIDKKLFEQYKLGSELENQDVVVKIFNPYGQGTWYIMNADPEEPDYLWGIVDLFETEMGSISRDELVSLRISPLKFKLERDTSFKPTNAKVIFDGLMDGKHFKFGGNVTYNTEKYFDQEIH